MELPDLLVQAPLWQWATLASLALGLVVALYGWGNEVPRPRWVLAVLRLATLSILGFLLLEPMWRTTTETRERPVLPVLVDATSSQWLGPDSVERRAALVEAMTQWSRWGTQAEWDVEVFEFDRDVREVALAEGLPWNPQGKRTDLGGALEDMRDRYVHRNVPAVVVVTDGRANRGVDPEFGASKLEVPHFAVATGDTSDVNDLVLAKLRMNEVAYLGNAFPVEVTAQARGAQDVPLRLRLESQGKVLGETAWTPESELASTSWSVTVDATEAGRQRLTARIAVPGAWEGEVTTINNQRTAPLKFLKAGAPSWWWQRRRTRTWPRFVWPPKATATKKRPSCGSTNFGPVNPCPRTTCLSCTTSTPPPFLRPCWMPLNRPVLCGFWGPKERNGTLGGWNGLVSVWTTNPL